VLFNSLGYSLVVAVAAAFIVYVLARPHSPVGKALSSPGIVLIGTISYGIYLFHPIVIELVARLLRAVGFYHQRIFAPVTLLIVVTLSWLSFRFFEQPIIRWGRRSAENPKVVVQASKDYFAPSAAP
jgi:peptidoglycan/LPS O-acetylase OafA/YrhL